MMRFNKLYFQNANKHMVILLIGIFAIINCGAALALESQGTRHDGDTVTHSTTQQSTPHQDHVHKHTDEHAMHKKLLNSSTVSIHATVNYSIPNVTLLNMHNQPVSLRDELSPDTAIMVNFIFTTCTTICPIMSATFSQVQRLLGEEADKVRMVSISIDPEQDTPEKLRAYAQKFSAGNSWHFLTGQLDDILITLKALDAYRGNKMNHQPTTLLRATANDEWTRIEGMTSAKQLVNTYRQSIARKF